MATVDLGGDTLIVGSVVSGVNTPGQGQIGNPNIINGSMEIGNVLFGYQTANSTTFTQTALTTLQPVFNISSNGAVTVSTNQTYMFEGQYVVSMATNAGHSYQIAFGGSATVASIGYQLYYTSNTASGTALANAVSLYVATAGTSAGSPVQTASGEVTNIFVTGMVSFNGGGTFIPQIKVLTAGTASVASQNLTISKGSYFGMWPTGNATSQTVGTWS